MTLMNTEASIQASILSVQMKEWTLEVLLTPDMAGQAKQPVEMQRH